LNGSQKSFNEEMKIAFDFAYQEYKAKLSAENKEEGRQIAIKYLQMLNLQKQNNALPKKLAAERNFSLSITNEELSIEIILNGCIDSIQLDPDGIYHVVDYKTTKNKKYLVGDYFQLLTYAYILLQEDNTIEKVRGSYMLLRHDLELITKDFYRDEIMSIQDKYFEYATKIINEKEYKATLTPLCNFCSFNHLCPDFQAKNGPQKFGEINW